jgi:hypothetical protein
MFNLYHSRVEVAADFVARRETTAVILFKQKVEIATLPSVARNDSALLEVTAHQQVARDDIDLKIRSSDLLARRVKDADI